MMSLHASVSLNQVKIRQLQEKEVASGIKLKDTREDPAHRHPPIMLVNRGLIRIDAGDGGVYVFGFRSLRPLKLLSYPAPSRITH